MAGIVGASRNVPTRNLTPKPKVGEVFHKETKENKIGV